MIHAQNTKYVVVTNPVLADNAAATSNEIDTLGFDYCEIVVVLGATDIVMDALAVTESDSSGSGHANVTGLIYGTSTTVDGATSTLPTADDDNETRLFSIDLKDRKRYLDVTVDPGNGSTGTQIAVLAILSRAGESVADTAAGRGVTEMLRV